MYVEKDSQGKVAIHDLTPYEAFLISMASNIYFHPSFIATGDKYFFEKLSQSIETEIFNKA